MVGPTSVISFVFPSKQLTSPFFYKRISLQHKQQTGRGDHRPGRGPKNLPNDRAVPKFGPHFFVSTARYFEPKLAGFCGPKRAGPKNRLKSRFWLAQSPPKYKKTRAQKFCPKPGQKADRAKMITSTKGADLLLIRCRPPSDKM